jgi:proteic killer suppression protein
LIRSFKCPDSEKLYNGKSVLRFAAFARQARRKLRILDASHDLRDLKTPPGNQLEKLKGDRAGQFSMRVNDRWRICFEWVNGNAVNVEIVDYHD